MAAIVKRAPRVARERTSMAVTAVNARPPHETYTGPALRIFDRIPPAHHDVIAARHDSTILRQGEVAVYETDTLGRDGIIEGAIYVVEHQRPRASMSYQRWFSSPEPRGQLEVIRDIVIVTRFAKVANSWATHPLRAKQPGVFLTTDYPIPDHVLRDKIIGRVVGIYNPAALGEVA